MAGGRWTIWGTLWGMVALSAGCAGSPWTSPATTSSQGAVRPVSFERATDQATAPPAGAPSGAESPFREMVARVTGHVADPQGARAAYAEAETVYAEAVRLREAGERDAAERRFLQAAGLFRRAALAWPDSAVEEDAWLHAGESAFFGNRFVQANEAYEQLLAKHPDSRYQDFVQARQLAIARYWLNANRADPLAWYEINLFDPTGPLYDWKGNALRLLKKIPLDNPTGKYADDAILAQANALFLDGKYDRADQLYDDLRTLYPTSPHQFTAHLMGIKTKMLRYQGPEYGGDVLDQAEKLIRRVRIQFPQEARANRELLDRAAREIRYRKAERDWFMARYYDRRGEYRAAAFYYKGLQENYDDTPFAARARERIGAIADKPPEPPQRLAWLVKLFPDRQPARPLLKTESTPRR